MVVAVVVVNGADVVAALFYVHAVVVTSIMLLSLL